MPCAWQPCTTMHALFLATRPHPPSHVWTAGRPSAHSLLTRLALLAHILAACAQSAATPWPGRQSSLLSPVPCLHRRLCPSQLRYHVLQFAPPPPALSGSVASRRYSSPAGQLPSASADKRPVLHTVSPAKPSPADPPQHRYRPLVSLVKCFPASLGHRRTAVRLRVWPARCRPPRGKPRPPLGARGPADASPPFPRRRRAFSGRRRRAIARPPLLIPSGTLRNNSRKGKGRFAKSMT
jgi:hypothetical protein